MENFEKYILFEDNHILIAFKGPGVLSQKDKTGDMSILELIKDYIAVKYNKPGAVFLGSVHRLDRPAMGIMVFARTSKALARLHESFRLGEIQKEYLAIVQGVPDDLSGSFTDYLLKDNKKNMVKAFDRPGQGAKMANLSYKLLDSRQGKSLLKINLGTGRPHQIRVQLAKRGLPIVGDLKYGATLKTKDKSIALMSARLSFLHPVRKETVKFKARYMQEKEYWNLFKNPAF